MSKHIFHIFKHIKGYRELTLKGVTQIYAEIPYKVFAVMPKDEVIEYFQMKPYF